MRKIELMAVLATLAIATPAITPKAAAAAMAAFRRDSVPRLECAAFGLTEFHLASNRRRRIVRRQPRACQPTANHLRRSRRRVAPRRLRPERSSHSALETRIACNRSTAMGKYEPSAPMMTVATTACTRAGIGMMACTRAGTATTMIATTIASTRAPIAVTIASRTARRR